MRRPNMPVPAAHNVTPDLTRKHDAPASATTRTGAANMAAKAASGTPQGATTALKAATKPAPVAKKLLAAKAGLPGARVASSAKARAKQAFEHSLTKQSSAPAPGEPPSKTAQAKEAGKDLLKGALKGASTGGAAGAVKGVALAAVKNKSIRTILIGAVCVTAMTSILLPMFIGSSIGFALNAMSGSDDVGSVTSVVESGETKDNILNARNGSPSNVPWQVTLAVQKMNKEVDTAKLSAAYFEVDSNGLTTDLAAGSLYDGIAQLRKLGESEREKQQSDAAKATTLSALKVYGLGERKAEAVYKQALKWVLGDPSAVCEVPPVIGDVNYAMDAEQTQNALTIMAVAKTMFPEADQRRAAIIALATARQESGMRSIDYGDEAGPDSRGLFQQRDSWGPLELRMNAAGSSGLFYSRLLHVEGWQTMKLGDAAMAVQIFQDGLEHHYDEKELWATNFAAANMNGVAPVTPPPGVPFTPPGTGEAPEPGDPNLPADGCMGVPTGDFTWPFVLASAHVTISDFFGPRNIPGTNSFHAALDFSMPESTPLYAAHGGTVAFAGNTGGLGNNIRIDGADGTYFTTYNHMLDGGFLVKKGDIVTAGQPIGLSGNTGASTGAHLHFQTFEKAESGVFLARDPVIFMLERGIDFRVVPINHAIIETTPTF